VVRKQLRWRLPTQHQHSQLHGQQTPSRSPGAPAESLPDSSGSLAVPVQADSQLSASERVVTAKVAVMRGWQGCTSQLAVQ